MVHASTDGLARPPALARARAGEAGLVHSVAMHAAVLRPRALVGPCSSSSRSGKRTNNRDGAAVMMSAEPPEPPATSNPLRAGRAQRLPRLQGGHRDPYGRTRSGSR